MNRIVVGVDGSANSRRALRWAVEEARLRGGSTIEAIHAWHYPYASGYPFAELAFNPDLFGEASRELLDDVVSSVDDHDLPAPIEKIAVTGQAAQVLLEAAKKADLLVVGSRGRGGFTSLLLGSVSQQCAEHAPVPLVVVREATIESTGGRIVVGIDGSPAADRALRWAAEEARWRDAVLEVVHGWQFPAAADFPGLARAGMTSLDIQHLAEQVLEGALERCGLLLDDTVVVKRTVSNDIPAPALLQAAEHADLLVVGSRGQGGFAGLLIGSVSQQCLHHAPCTIAIIHA